MQKFLPIALFAIMIIGCKGGDTTAATGGGAAAGSGTTYTLRMNPRQGEKYAYMVTQTGPQTMEMGMTMACEKAENGKFTMVTTFDSLKMDGKEAPAMVMESMKKMKMTTVTDSTGKTLETKVEGAPAGSTPDSSNPSYPSGPVKIGDTWTGTSKVGGKEVNYTYKLASVANEGGSEVATLEATATGLPEGATIEGPMVVKIDVGSGMPVSMKLTTKSKGADGKDITSTMEMKRR